MKKNNEDIRDSDPIAHHLLKIEWSVFGTVTWDDPMARIDSPEGEQLRRHDFDRFILKTATVFKLRPKNIAVYQSMERGAASQCHYHFLIAKKGLEKVTDIAQLCMTMEQIWKEVILADSPRNADAKRVDIVPFKSELHAEGVRYVTKRERNAAGQLDRVDFMSPRLMKMLKSLPE